MYDIGIIGGGTAGLTAAIYGQRAGKRTLVIEGLNFGGQIVNSPKVENYPGLESISGSQYSMNLLNQAMKLGAETASERVKEVREEDGIKIIVTDQKEYPCKAVILATGVAHRHLGIPQEEALAGSGVSYCATCDGAFFRGKDVAVIGGGNTALQDAIFSNQLFILSRINYFIRNIRFFQGIFCKLTVRTGLRCKKKYFSFLCIHLFENTLFFFLFCLPESLLLHMRVFYIIHFSLFKFL